MGWGTHLGPPLLEDRELQSPAGLPFPCRERGCRGAFGGDWDQAVTGERGLNDSVFGGCCII